jgi:predicted type IV restriction endonuclease
MKALESSSYRMGGDLMFDIINFKSELEKISKNVIENKLLIRTEEQTKLCIVLPFLHAMGYDCTDPTVVKTEFNCESDSGTTRVDFAIFRDDEIYMLIEVKSLTHKLCEKDITQLSNYFIANSSEIGLLTNGVDFYFYKASGKNQKMDVFPYIMCNITDLLNNDYAIKQLSQLAGGYKRHDKKSRPKVPDSAIIPKTVTKEDNCAIPKMIHTENNVQVNEAQVITIKSKHGEYAGINKMLIDYVRENRGIAVEELLHKFSKKDIQMAIMCGALNKSGKCVSVGCFEEVIKTPSTLKDYNYWAE